VSRPFHFLSKENFIPSWQPLAQCTPCKALSYEVFSKSVSLCLLCTVPPPRYSITLRFLLSFVIPLVFPPSTVFSDSEEFRCTLLGIAIEPPMFYCALLEHPKEPRTIFQSQMKIKKYIFLLQMKPILHLQHNFMKHINT
jgi:hypothetical protein